MTSPSVPLTLTVAALLQRLADGATLDNLYHWWLIEAGIARRINSGAPDVLRRDELITLNYKGWIWQLSPRGRSALVRLKATEEKT